MTTGLVSDSGTLWVGPTTAVAPTVANLSTAMDTIDTDWVNVGSLAKDGIAVNSDPQIKELFSFGSPDPTRTIKQREVKRFTAKMQDWNTGSFTVAFNGGTVTVTTGVAKYVPPSDTHLEQHALCWEYEDGTALYRLYMPLVEVRSGVQLDFSDEDYTTLPLDVTILKPTGGDAWELITNNAAFTATP